MFPLLLQRRREAKLARARAKEDMEMGLTFRPEINPKSVKILKQVHDPSSVLLYTFIPGQPISNQIQHRQCKTILIASEELAKSSTYVPIDKSWISIILLMHCRLRGAITDRIGGRKPGRSAD